MLTDEELDRARAIEGQRLAWLAKNNSKSRGFPHLHELDQNARILAAKLAREGWVPVDPKVIRAREIVAVIHSSLNKSEILRGSYDKSPIIEAVLMALNEKTG